MTSATKFLRARAKGQRVGVHLRHVTHHKSLPVFTFPDGSACYLPRGKDDPVEAPSTDAAITAYHESLARDGD